MANTVPTHSPSDARPADARPVIIATSSHKNLDGSTVPDSGTTVAAMPSERGPRIMVANIGFDD